MPEPLQHSTTASTASDRPDGGPSSSARRAAVHGAERQSRDASSDATRQILTAGGSKGPLSGARWDSYDIGDLLGEGGMATVYLARRRSDQRVIALKVLPGHLAGDAGSRARFLLEARTARSLRSPHIVQVYKVDSYSNLLFFEMELVEGETLSDLIRRHRDEERLLPALEAADCVLQVAHGLCEASRNQLVHRDIKPGNLMRTTDGTVKIADFGIVKVMDEEALTMTGIALGTPAYMSPEQGRADGVDQRADIYSLGVVFYELLTNIQPFTGGSADALIYQHNFAEPTRINELRQDLPPGLEAVVFKCLQKRPENRYQSPDELVADLELVLAGTKPTIATFAGNKITCGADEMLAAHGLNRRWWPVALAVCLVLVVLGGGYWWWAAHQQQVTALRERLAPLDQPVAVPDAAGDDLQRLAKLAGNDDGDVLRWRAKLSTIGDLEERLQTLRDDHEIDHAMLAAARVGLEQFQNLLGGEAPLAIQTRQRLETIDRRIASSLDQLRALDAVEVVPLPLQAQVAQPLALLDRLLPDDDPAVRGWQAKLEDSLATIDELRTRLARLDEASPLTQTEHRTLQPVLERLRELSDSGDQAVVRWQTRLGLEQARFESLKQSLLRLDEGDYAPRHLIVRLHDELAAFAQRVDPDHRDLQRWQARIAATQQHLETLHAELAVLDRDGLTIGDVTDLSDELEAYARLVASDDQDLRRWRRTTATLRERAEALQAIIDSLDSRERLNAEERTLLHDTLAEASRLGLLDESQQERYRRLLARQEALLVILRQRLSVLDQEQDFGSELLTDLREYETAVDAKDPDALRWRAKADHVTSLKQRLSILDGAAPIPTDAPQLLEQLAAAIGSESGKVPTWRAKLQRVQAIKQRLAPIDDAAPLPDAAGQLLTTLVEEVGEADPDVVRWRRSLVEIEELLQRFVSFERHLVLQEWADEAATRLAGMLGEAPVVRRIQARIAELDPPAPVWAATAGRDRFGPYADLQIGSVTQRFRYVAPGSVTLGSPPNEHGRDGDEAPVVVKLSRGFWIADTECSQAMWLLIMGTRPSYSPGNDHPVERVSWEDVQHFLTRLNTRVPGLPARLPTEAEWEHACRAGSSSTHPPSPLSPDADLSRLAVHAQRERASSAAVASRHPNALGLYDMLGNVWEWCADSYGAYPTRPVEDRLHTQGRNRVVRGASWYDLAERVRCANRHSLHPGVRSAYVGFRLAISLEAEGQP